MPVTHHKLGPGTLKLGPTGTPLEFNAECRAASITHEYEDVGEDTIYLDDHTDPASANRKDGFKAAFDNDLSAAGAYAYQQTNDLATVDIEFTPNTAAGAKWVGKVQIRLPGNIGADEMGNKITSEVEWKSVGPLAFTPATAAGGLL